MDSLSVSESELCLEKKDTGASVTTGLLWHGIWQLSWPLYVHMMTIAIADFSQVWVAGKLGSSAQAAVGLASQIWFFMVLLVIGLSTGSNALVSRFWGAGDKENAILAARQSIMLSFIFGVGVALAGLLLCRPLMRILGAPQAVEELGWQMLRIEMIGQPLITVQWISNAIFRARGNTRIPMIVMVLVSCLVIVLNFVLCVWPLHMGITGLGLAWPLASLFGVVLALYLQKKSDIGACLAWKGAGPSLKWFWRLMKIGIPSCIQELAWVGGNFVLLFILAQSKNPTAGEAAWAIGMRVEETLNGMPVCALSLAVATLVGQNLGAGKPERAEQAGWQVSALSIVYSIVIAAVLFIGAQEIACLMSKDPAVIEHAANYMRVVGLAQPFVSVWLILVGAMQGAGYTRWPMAATVLVLIFFRLPFAWLLTVSQGMGPNGTWLSMAISGVLAALVMCFLFKLGLWKQQQV